MKKRFPAFLSGALCALLLTALGTTALAASGSPEEWLDKMRARLSARAPEDNDNNTAAAVWAEEE